MAGKAPDALSTYNRKRNFSKTTEPKGGITQSSSGRLFMVQKHDATRLHFDLRLELDGVLKSWAVTRGPSADPADKRLAVRTEDHPVSYAEFEGTIPSNEYGGGTVMLWDWGEWVPVPGKDPRKTLEEGHLHFTLHGQRMKGEWILIRLKGKPGERAENWLLRKVEDEGAASTSALTDAHLTSIKTGRTMNEIATGKQVNPLTGWRAPRRRATTPKIVAKRRPTAPRRAVKIPMPRFHAPQLATLMDTIPSGDDWIHELKYDGYRCQLAVGEGRVKIHTRSGLDWTHKFPEIAEAARKLRLDAALLDGEIVAIDENGKPNFSLLQKTISEGGRGLTLYLFDALELNGEELTALGNVERKTRLAEMLGDGVPPYILYADHVTSRGEELFDAVCEAGQEGIISKKAEAPYRGARTKNWRKIKCTPRQEFVIVGWLPSDKNGRGFRSLLLGVNEEGQLRYAGKVGTGFTMDVQNDLVLRMETLEATKAPLAVPPSESRGAHWLKPKLVAEIAFGEMTSGGIVRHATFIGLREDKKARDVSAESTEKPTGAIDSIKISNPGRVIFPDAGITKGELADYYRAVSSLIEPWITSRPLSLVRCPQGRARKCFFQKHDSGSFGEDVLHVPIEEGSGKVEEYLYVDSSAGVISCVQMGTIEFHGWGSSVEDVEKPDRMVFDLDPDEGLDFTLVKKAALELRDYLAGVGLQTFPMLTGGKGIHVVVPLTPNAKWPEVEDFARRFALALAQAHSDRFTANLSKAHRKGRIFIDYLRNKRGATAIVPYSARAREGAPVAAPIQWNELKSLKNGASFTIREAKALLKRASGRTLEEWGQAAQELPDI
jgi:bifunctional non-homologous end joining protein LigD